MSAELSRAIQCAQCGIVIIGDVYRDHLTGGLLCKKHRTADSILYATATVAPKFSPTPWKVKDHMIEDADGNVVVYDERSGSVDLERIVLCVNACDGATNGVLLDHKYLHSLMELVAREIVAEFISKGRL